MRRVVACDGLLARASDAAAAASRAVLVFAFGMVLSCVRVSVKGVLRPRSALRQAEAGALQDVGALRRADAVQEVDELRQFARLVGAARRARGLQAAELDLGIADAEQRRVLV